MHLLLRQVLYLVTDLEENEISLIKKILRVRPTHRPTIDDILEHPFCKEAKEKKSIRTTIASEEEERQAVEGSKAIKSSLQFAAEMKPPSSPSYLRNIFEHRPISSNGYFYKDYREGSK